MTKISTINGPTLQAICDVIGDTQHGLTGSEIGKLLSECNINDPFPGDTKRFRLFKALYEKQKVDGCANNVLNFVLTAINPVRYVGMKEYYESQCSRLNEVLAFLGLSVGEDGKLSKIKAAQTLNEAEERAGRLRKNLSERKVHSDVLKFCQAELIQDNYFHAVFEATKSVADKIRNLSGLQLDGASLVDDAFSFGKKGFPLLAINTLQTESERSEQKGFINLLKGLFGTFRNTTAHAPKIHWTIDEQDALDILTLTSLLHRKLDTAVRTHIP